LINFNLWSRTLEHILVYPIVIQCLVIIKTLETLYKTHFVSIILLYFELGNAKRTKDEDQGGVPLLEYSRLNALFYIFTSMFANYFTMGR